MMKTKRLFIELNVRDGEREYSQRVLHTTTAKNLEFAAQRYASTFLGYSSYEKESDCWYAVGGEVAIQVEKVKQLTEEQYYLMYNIFY